MGNKRHVDMMTKHKPNDDNDDDGNQERAVAVAVAVGVALGGDEDEKRDGEADSGSGVREKEKECDAGVSDGEEDDEDGAGQSAAGNASSTTPKSRVEIVPGKVIGVTDDGREIREVPDVDGFYDDVEIEDMEFDEETCTYYYPCPCGDRFAITEDELRDGEEVARCPSCSLTIRVVYDPEDFMSDTDSESDDDSDDD